MNDDISQNETEQDLDQERQNLLERINRNREIYESLNNIITNTINQITEEQSIAQAIDESLRMTNPYKKTISEKGLSDIKYLRYNEEIHQNTNCPITLEDLSQYNEKTVAQLPCNHIATPDEIVNWLKEKPECPICRYEMDSIEEKINEEPDDDEDNYDDDDDDEEPNEFTPPSPPPHPHSLENYPTQSTILNTLLYLNYNNDEEVIEQRNSFMRNLNTLSRLNQ